MQGTVGIFIVVNGGLTQKTGKYMTSPSCFSVEIHFSATDDKNEFYNS